MRYRSRKKTRRPTRGRAPVLRLHHDDPDLVVDLFAGGGGASLGIEQALGRSPDFAINHDPEAVALHRANHPSTTHYCGDVHDVKPADVVGDRRVAMAWFSPDCQYFSKARGGKPFRDPKSAKGRRGLAWVVIRWARAVRPRIIFLENVEEFADWGPLGEDGRPDPTRRGWTFRRWWGELRACGYEIEMRELRACDYGAPTIRKRLFIIARCDGKPIVWPAATHGPGLEPYRAAAECIDWSIPCPSIFGRKKPLAEKTMARIARGIRRFVIDSPKPFIVPTAHAGDLRCHSIDEPMRTITGAHRGDHALVTPFVARSDMHLSNAGCVFPVTDPLRTVTTSNGHGLVAATLVHSGNGERPGQAPRVYDIERPLTTIVAEGQKHGLVAAALTKYHGGASSERVQSLEDPFRTLDTANRFGLVQAFISKQYGGHEATGSPLHDPLHTVTAQGQQALVASTMVKLHGSCADGQDWRAPAPTVRAQGMHLAETRAFLTRYNGVGEGQPLQLSLGTITTKDRFGLVTVDGVDYEITDIGFRMLQPRELYLAQGFPDSYAIDVEAPSAQVELFGDVGKRLTKEAQIRMCGNSVPPPVVAALVRANVKVERRAAA